ncbi:acetate--CoA ligase family protein [Sedimentitalea nanhaiensis]|uniref:Acetyl-CoA synthetase n=1 Tax=Sedimentitalea nanhaiensis TaxID=999627 RepID=A0A1I7DD74_9RHOB|nr:acetate--CoA ligase family protein [Sedimentitalea nanhaiensis]SFU09638.1 acetyl-CoA synthetase [Sedimentitalea nanhaiensis]
MRDLARLLNPHSIAVIGGGAWCASIMQAADRIGFSGEIFPVHPEGKNISGRKALRRLEDWPEPIDAAFVGINRHGTIAAIETLSGLNAGGAVCFASGFTEATAEDAGGADLQAQLVWAAGRMPILGPNCYGFINALDRVAIWPDQHGMQPVDRGVAILSQSSNIAINLTMQKRGLPIAYMVTCGNMAQVGQAELAAALLDDTRVTAIGLHVEGFGDLRAWEALAQKANTRGVPLVALKVGRSEQARQATVSHTASLAGSDAGAQAFLDRLGIARLHGLPEFLETLKLLHCTGRLGGNRIASISCSGGEASLVADMATTRALSLPPLDAGQKETLRHTLGPMVALANPLDYHTYVWRDADAMAQAWAGMTGGDIDLTLSIVDYPHTDATDWDCATQAAIQVRRDTGRPFAVVATLPELMPEPVARDLMAHGVVPLAGLNEALAAAEAAAVGRAPCPEPVLLPGSGVPDLILNEAEAKAALAAHGLHVPAWGLVLAGAEMAKAAEHLRPPFVVKGLGLTHKSEHGAVRLGLQADDLARAAQEIGTDEVLIEEMETGGVAELLVGVTRDAAHGFVLTLGAGGVLTELLRDTVSLLVPSPPEQVEQALRQLGCAPLLAGYRGKPAAQMAAILRAVMAVQSYVIANADTVTEVEINPLICTPDRAIAVDALIRKARK